MALNQLVNLLKTVQVVDADIFRMFQGMIRQFFPKKLGWHELQMIPVFWRGLSRGPLLYIKRICIYTYDGKNCGLDGYQTKSVWFKATPVLHQILKWDFSGGCLSEFSRMKTGHIDT